MSPATSVSLRRLCAKLASRGHLQDVERIVCHHRVTIYDAFSMSPSAELARRDIARLLYRRGVSMVTLCDWFGAEPIEVRTMLTVDKEQARRIQIALGGIS